MPDVLDTFLRYQFPVRLLLLSRCTEEIDSCDAGSKQECLAAKFDLHNNHRVYLLLEKSIRFHIATDGGELCSIAL